MERKIVCYINTTNLIHKVWIEQNGQIVKEYQFLINAIPDFILQHRDIKNIYIHGNKSFCKKIEDEVNNSIIKKYDNIERKFYYM